MTVDVVTSMTEKLEPFNEDSYNRIYDASRASWANNVNPLAAYYSEESGVTRGRRFGIEIEMNNAVLDNTVTYIETCECPCMCYETCEGECYDPTIHAECTEKPGRCGCECFCYEICDGLCWQDSCECLTSVWTELADELCNEGFIEEPYVRNYHHDDAYSTLAWRYEYDGTVDGGELITPILNDTGDSWRRIAGAMNLVSENGATAWDKNVGGHINISTNGEYSKDASMQVNLQMFALKFEDVMYRLGTNPERAKELGKDESIHRGSQYATKAVFPSDSGISVLLDGSWLNVNSAYGPDGRIEFRVFDGTLDPAFTQTWTMIAAAIVDKASQGVGFADLMADMPDRPLGFHQRSESGGWGKDTRAIREFVNLLFDNEQDKERVITLFAMNDWSK